MQGRNADFLISYVIFILLFLLFSIACATVPRVINKVAGQSTETQIPESPTPIILVVTATPLPASPTLERFPTEILPTATELQPTPTNTIPPSTPTQSTITYGGLECVLWSEVNLSHVGKRMCVYGNYVDTENWEELVDITKKWYVYEQYILFIFAHDTRSFRLLAPTDSGFWIWGEDSAWRFEVPTDCVMARGIIESYGPRPMMKTKDISSCPK
jgi:hypothetical protein